MKHLLYIFAIIFTSSIYAQDLTPKYEVQGELVKVQKFYDNGSVKEEGFYLNTRPHGTWYAYDQEGKKTTIAQYDNGQKVGKWLIWTGEILNEVNYQNNTIADVQQWKEAEKVAIK